jgi:hypothetical protein
MAPRRVYSWVNMTYNCVPDGVAKPAPSPMRLRSKKRVKRALYRGLSVPASTDPSFLSNTFGVNVADSPMSDSMKENPGLDGLKSYKKNLLFVSRVQTDVVQIYFSSAIF